MDWTFPSRLIALGLRAFGWVNARKLLFVYGVRFAVLLGLGFSGLVEDGRVGFALLLDCESSLPGEARVGFGVGLLLYYHRDAA